METDQITRAVVNERRQADKLLKDDAEGLVARAVREGTPIAEMALRESNDGRTELIGLVRVEFARLAGITLTQPAPESDAEAPVEGVADVIPEQEGLDERIQNLVVTAIDALPENKRNVLGKVRTGEEIARAIPYAEAFLAEVDLMQDGVFFELNEAGQLVMRDGCAEAYGLEDDFSTAKKRQTRVVYRGEDGTTQVIEGDDAKSIDTSSILMVRGLPILQGAYPNYTGEYARMNTGQLEKETRSWTDDSSLDSSRARVACWYHNRGDVYSVVYRSNIRDDDLGSRGVLRVNLNLES